MQYQSTRDKNLKASSAQAILNGLAPDGGLYTMSSFDEVKFDYTTVLNMDTMSMSTKILSKLLPDFSEAEMAKLVHDGYTGKFETDHLTPTVPVGEDFILELFRGPTSAFKDVALSMLPRLMTASKEKLGVDDEIMILTATSGDTGKAAMEGFCDVPGTKIIVFYPHGGVSAVQQAQMATQAGENVCVCAVRGNFDDAQTGVKKIFADASIAKELDEKGAFLSSANSINWGRLAPQIVYYVSAYCDLLLQSAINPGDEIDVCVPTGNFGNIFAAYIAKRMGLPICRLVCASNRNNILTDFLRTGTYDRNRRFYTTMSPSMDILISSNLERLLYTVGGAEKTAACMRALCTDGKYTVDASVKAKIDESFLGYFCDEELTKRTIRETFDAHHYLCDTHTAVGLAAARQYIAEHGGTRKIVLASTASPYKFANDVYTALTDKVADDELAALSALAAYSHTEIPAPLAGIDKRPVRFTKTIDVCDMPADVLSFAK